MQSDRVLLEFAAKAAGYECYRTDDQGRFQVKTHPMSSWTLWNPRDDDGDAFRLGMHLGMRVSVREAHADGGRIRVTDTTEDPMAATRYAIVIAAAEMSKAHNVGANRAAE